MLKDDKHLIHYVPHGINPNTYKPLDKKEDVFKNVYNAVYGDKKYDYVIGFVSTNTHRKNPTNLILAFRAFCDSLTPEQAKKCALVLHTKAVIDQGTDLIAVKDSFARGLTVIIDQNSWNSEQMNCLYNTFDVYVNCSSNEGFGLGVAEALMSGVPVCATVTGGLQDQMGFVDDDGNPMEFTREFASNFDMTYTKHGKWVYPLIPQSKTVKGSPITPYVMEEYADFTLIRDGLKYWYNMDANERKECGAAGREFCLNDGGFNSYNMCCEFIKAMDYTLENFIPNKKFVLEKWSDHYDIRLMPNNQLGFKLNE